LSLINAAYVERASPTPSVE